MNKNKDLTKTSFIDQKSEPNLSFTHRDLDIMLDGNAVALKFTTKGDNKIIMIFCFMTEATDRFYDHQDLLQMKKKYKVMIMKFPRKMIEHIYDRDVIHIIHAEPLDQYCPSEFWIMSQQTRDDINKYDNNPEEISKRFLICERTDLVAKRNRI